MNSFFLLHVSSFKTTGPIITKSEYLINNYLIKIFQSRLIADSGPKNNCVQL
jgi:hypothetical protein